MLDTLLLPMSISLIARTRKRHQLLKVKDKQIHAFFSECIRDSDSHVAVNLLNAFAVFVVF